MKTILYHNSKWQYICLMLITTCALFLYIACEPVATDPEPKGPPIVALGIVNADGSLVAIETNDPNDPQIGETVRYGVPEWDGREIQWDIYRNGEITTDEAVTKNEDGSIDITYINKRLADVTEDADKKLSLSAQNENIISRRDLFMQLSVKLKVINITDTELQLALGLNVPPAYLCNTDNDAIIASAKDYRLYLNNLSDRLFRIDCGTFSPVITTTEHTINPRDPSSDTGTSITATASALDDDALVNDGYTTYLTFTYDASSVSDGITVSFTIDAGSPSTVTGLTITVAGSSAVRQGTAGYIPYSNEGVGWDVDPIVYQFDAGTDGHETRIIR